MARPGDSVTSRSKTKSTSAAATCSSRENDAPSVGTEFQATLVWMHAEPLDPHKIYLLKHTTRTVRARIKQIRYRVDVNTLEHVPGDEAST